MARYSQGFRLSGTGAGTPLLELIGGAGSRARLVEFGLTPITQVVGSVGLGFAAAIGITPTNPVTFQNLPLTQTFLLFFRVPG